MKTVKKSFKTLPVLLILLLFIILFCPVFILSCKKEAALANESIKSKTDETSKIDEKGAVYNRYEVMRTNMVETQIIARDIKDNKVIETMLKVPRHHYVDESQWDSAYDDRPLPIGMGQTISQPYIVALMTESLNLSGGEKVLEIGTGSGYQAAVLAEIVDEVYTVEIIPSLYSVAKERLEIYKNIKTSNHDGYYGWEEHAPFDRIMVTAAPDHIPQPLIAQLKDGGIMVIPVGSPGWNQTLYKVIKDGESIKTIEIAGVIFVPLTRDKD